MSRLSHLVPALAAPFALAAQDAQHLSDFYREARRASPRLAAATALADAARARVAPARRPPDPQLQLGLMNRNLPGFGPMAVLGMSQLQVMQMVPIGGKLALAGRVASASADAELARAADVWWDVRREVAMAWYDIYATDQGLGVERETLRLLRDIANTAESMYRVGDGRQADVLRARVEIARMVEDTLRMQAMRATMIARLNATLDRDPSSPVPSASLPRFPDSLSDRAWLDSLASAARPMIRAGLEQLNAAESAEQLARRELVPDLQVGVQYAQQRAFGADGMPAGGRAHMASVMVGASVPVFARSRQLQMRTEAAAMRQMAQAEVAAMRAATRGQLGETLATLERARRLAVLYRTEILPQAMAAVGSSLAAYRAGSVDFMTLLDNRMNVNRYQQELATLEAEQGKAWAELEMLVGRPLLASTSPASAPGATGGPR